MNYLQTSASVRCYQSLWNY